MPISSDDNKYYDFEELFFEKNRDVDSIITSFFTKYKEDMLNILPIKLKNSLGKIEIIL